MNAPELFREAIAAAGLTAPDQVLADGQLHRFASNGDRSDDAGWYVLHSDGLPAGAFGCHRANVTRKWCSKATTALNATERRLLGERLRAMRQQRQDDQRRQHAEAATRARTIWAEAQPASDDHPYLMRKQVTAHGLRVTADGRLLVPIAHGDVVSSLEFIDQHGDKKYLFGGAKHGGAFVLGDPTNATTLLVCEGYATGASLYEATHLPTVIAFDAGNVHPVATRCREQCPTATILICGDNDLHADGKPNTGRLEATKAAHAIGGLLVLPELDGTKCDWNDVHVQRGLGAVRLAIEAARVPPPSILDDVHKFLGRFVSYPSAHAHVAHTLWVTHTHLMDCWESTPRLAFLSPEPGSGKTRALELTETLVPRPVEAVNVSSAYLFRKISDPNGLPTILHDEIDTVFGARALEHEEIRGVINAGHRRGASAGRCVMKGKIVETEELPAFCPIAMAGLGNLPETILSRSVIVKMRRRTAGEPVEAYRRRAHAPEGHALRDRLAAWATLIRTTLNTYPAMPDGITDRNADVWESLLSVADAAGGPWPERARVSAVAQVSDAIGRSPSLGIRLLSDIKGAFADHDAVSTADLLAYLIVLEEAPWGDLKGKPLDSRRLANLLRPYGIASKTIRVGATTPRGYTKENFHDAWARYVPVVSETSETSPPDTRVCPGIGAGTGTGSGTDNGTGYIYRIGSDPGPGLTQTVDGIAGDPPIANETSTTETTDTTDSVDHSPDDDCLVIYADAEEPAPAPRPDTSAYPPIRHWVEEREAIRLKKEAGLPAPWTTDPILGLYKFCNVRRRDDRVSRWILAHVIEPYRAAPYLLEWLALGRWVNWPVTLQDLLDAGHTPYVAPDWPAIGQLIEARGAVDEKCFGGAYVVPSPSNPLHPWFKKPKGRFVCEGVLAPLFTSRDQILRLCETGVRREVHAFLAQHDFFGSFLAGQVVDDWTWCPLLAHATDLYTWAPLGPGSQRGLNRLANRPLTTTISNAVAVAEMIALRQRLIADLPWTECLTLHDIQNICCEGDKFLRVLHGEATTLKATYRPETAYTV